MDIIWIVTVLSNIVIAGMGWALKTLYQEHKDLRQMLQATREQYVHKEDLRQMKEEISTRFDRLETLLMHSRMG